MKSLSDEQRAGLRGLASRIHAGVSAKDLHDLRYAVSEESGISVSKMFQAIYIPIPGNRSGPKRGVLHGVSGPGVFAGPTAGGWWRMNNLQWAVNMSDAESKDRTISLSLIHSTFGS